MADEKIPSSNLADEILKLVEEIIHPSADEFTRKQDLGLEWYFHEIESDYEGLKKYLSKITQSALEQIPDFQLNIIKGNLDQLNGVIQQIKTFSSKVKQPTPTTATPPPQGQIPQNYAETVKNQIIILFRNVVSRLYSSTQIIITFGRTAALDELEKLQGAVKFSQRTVSSREIGDQVSEFEVQSANNKANANWWLAFAILIAIGLALFIWFGIEKKDEILKLYSDNQNNMSIVTAELIRLVIIRILEISLLGYALAFCIKNYNSQKHNAILKDHKANCLKTYLFYEATNIFKDNEITRQEVLKRASEAIFEKDSTGYTNEGGDLKSPSFITNIIEKAIEKQQR